MKSFKVDKINKPNFKRNVDVRYTISYINVRCQHSNYPEVEPLLDFKSDIMKQVLMPQYYCRSSPYLLKPFSISYLEKCVANILFSPPHPNTNSRHVGAFPG